MRFMRANFSDCSARVLRALPLGLLAFCAQGQNLINNGDFSSGSLSGALGTASTTGYTSAANPTTQGQYHVYSAATDSGTVFANRTTSDTGQNDTTFMAVNGSTGGTAVVWVQVVADLNILGHLWTTYTFSFWIAPGNGKSAGNAANRATINVKINGDNTALSASSITAGTTAGTYTQFTATWPPGCRHFG